ncbi:MAG: hypothetical protein E7E18_11330, partial [Eubacterium sp.]|nr:hypothetical protein [Eubacterium sp.]
MGHVKAGDIFVQCGICAGAEQKKGVAYLCSKITEEATQKTFYPDILYRHPFPEAAVVTGMNVRRKASVSEEHVCQKADMPQNTDTANPVKLCDTELYNIELYDMEAAAGYQAAHHFFGPHQMFFIKIISDNGVQEKMSADTVRELVQAQIGQIAQAVERFAAAERDYAREQQVLSQEEQRQAERLSHDMHCSAVMEAELFQLLKYCRLSGIDYEDIIRDGYAAGSLPCKDKKEGKRCLEQLRKELL